jgi:hypothetical protein
MSLYVCDASHHDEVQIIKSRFLKNKINLIVGEEAGCTYLLVSDALYPGQDKYYFPFLRHILFIRSSKKELPEGSPVHFKGLSLKEDEVQAIEDAVKKKRNDEKIKYGEYKKTLDKEISSLIGSLLNETENQKGFLEEDLIPITQLHENIEVLLDAYKDILKIKIENDLYLHQDDKAMIYDFYANMIDGLRNAKSKK